MYAYMDRPKEVSTISAFVHMPPPHLIWWPRWPGYWPALLPEVTVGRETTSVCFSSHIISFWGEPTSGRKPGSDLEIIFYVVAHPVGKWGKEDAFSCRTNFMVVAQFCASNEIEIDVFLLQNDLWFNLLATILKKWNTFQNRLHRNYQCKVIFLSVY